jgi:dTDP-4-dehydrorhamnose reductase
MAIDGAAPAAPRLRLAGDSSSRTSSPHETVAGSFLPPTPKTAIIGAGGFLGRELLMAYRARHPDALGTWREPTVGEPRLDLAAADVAPLRLAETGHQAAIIAAGMTNVAACQRDAQFAFSRNVTGTLRLASQLAALGLQTIFLSSDYVFDGARGGYDDDATQRPLNVYGACKAQVERKLPEVCGGNFLVVRLSKVFGLAPGDGTLLDEMAARLSQDRPVRAATDQVFCPTYVGDVVRAVLSLQAAGARGIVNVCAAEVWRRSDLAIALAGALGAAPALVEEITLRDLGEGFVRPRRTDMQCTKLTAACSPHAPIGFRPIRACLEEMAAHYTRRSKSDGKDGNRAGCAA